MPFDYSYQPVAQPAGFGGFDWGFNGGGSNNFSQYGANSQVQPGGIGSPGFSFDQNYGGRSPITLQESGLLNWGNAANTMGAIQGGLSLVEGFKDLFGKSDADKQRKFAKDFTMRNWNTNALMHDNQLQKSRNVTASYNAAHGTSYDNNAGLQSLGTWGSGKNRVPGG